MALSVTTAPCALAGETFYRRYSWVKSVCKNGRVGYVPLSSLGRELLMYVGRIGLRLVVVVVVTSHLSDRRSSSF